MVVRFSGSWSKNDTLPTIREMEDALRKTARVQSIAYEASSLGNWDSRLLAYLLQIASLAAAKGIAIDPSGLPPGVQRLVALAQAVPERKGARRVSAAIPFLTQVGAETQRLWRQMGEMIAFIGDVALAFGRLMRGSAKFRRTDLFLLIQDCGAQALPIVSLISVLVGLILAFVGAVQLNQFGAQIFVADLVGIAMAREMGALMTGIIMAGRTGAAFAAQLGTMEVNEEIDALKTFGFSPLDFLVLPRMLALILMMPFLCLYSDLLGIIGGGLVGVTMLDITLSQYVNETLGALSLVDFLVGVVKSIVFGGLIAMAGCLRGMQCGRSASAVGAAATSAVVMAIVLLVVADGMFSVILAVLGI